MTTVAEILTAAYRENNILARGQSLSETEQSEALPLLQGVILSTLGADLGYIMEDWNIVDDVFTKPNGVPIPTADISTFTVRPNSRLICNLAGEIVLTLDPQPQDGQRFSVVDAAGSFNVAPLTISPNGRKFQGSDGDTQLNTVDTAKQWLYRSDIADWVVLDTLAVDDEMPFPSDFDDYFTIALAERVNPRHGMVLSDASRARAQQQRMQFVNRYTQSRLRSIPAPPENNPARGG